MMDAGAGLGVSTCSGYVSHKIVREYVAILRLHIYTQVTRSDVQPAYLTA